MKPIRILHIVGTMNRGGAETLLMELYRHIDRNKVQFDFLIYNYSGKPGAFDEEILSLGGKIFETKQRFYRNPFAFIHELKEFFKTHSEYRIVHSHQYAMSGYMLWAAKKTSQPVTIAHSHIAFPITDFLRKCADNIGKKLLKNYADFYFGCSEDAVVELFGKQTDNKTCFVIKNAINVEKFAFSTKTRNHWRQTLNANDDTLIIGNVARFNHQKNHTHIIKTFAKLNEIKNNSLLLLIGDGTLRPQIEDLAKKLSVYEKVHFLGVRSNVQEIINAFDIFLMPSHYEGLGIVLIEAQANGLPCVISEDVIPAEADAGAGLITRVSLAESPKKWAEACLNAGNRKPSEEIKPAIINSGYDIDAVANWLQNFYIEHWN